MLIDLCVEFAFVFNITTVRLNLFLFVSSPINEDNIRIIVVLNICRYILIVIVVVLSQCIHVHHHIHTCIVNIYIFNNNNSNIMYSDLLLLVTASPILIRFNCCKPNCVSTIFPLHEILKYCERN